VTDHFVFEKKRNYIDANTDPSKCLKVQ